MTEQLFNYQQEPRPFGMKTRRLNTVTRILLAIFAMMLIPQSTLAQVDYYMYDGSKFVKTRADSPSALSGSQSTVNDFSLGAGTYYVPSGSPVTYSGCLVIDGTVNIILCDGATLNANHGIAVGYDATLNIYGQEKGTGQLIASGYNFNSGGTDYYKGPAIGGYYRQMGNNSATTSQCGKIFIHGGIITASSYSPIGSFDDAAGIGGWGVDGASNGPRELTVYGGKVTATGGLYGAGIGGGRNGEGGTVNIYGGEVIATGGDGDRSNNAPARGIGAGVSTAVVAAAPGNGTLTLGSGVTCYGDNTNTDPTGLNPQTTVSTRYQYMKTDRTYDLAVGVTTVKASNASNINSASTGTASFYPATNTLILNNLSANGPIVSNLANLTIVLNDENKLTGTQGYIESNNTSATLTIKKGSDGYLTLTNSTGTSAVSGFASVTLEDVYIHTSNCYKYDDDGSKKMAYLTPSGDYSGWSNVQDLEFTTDVYYPLWIESQQVKGSTASYSCGNGTASFAPASGSTPATLSLKDATIGTSNCIDTSLPELRILLDGVNTLSTCDPNHYSPIYSIVGTSKLIIAKAQNAKSSLLTLSTCYDENTPIRVVRGFSSVEVLDDLLCDITLGNGTTLNDANTLGATVYMNFPLWINGDQVTSLNCGNVLGDLTGKPTVIYDPVNFKLTLDGVSNIRVSGDDPGIKSGLDNLTVNLASGSYFQFNGNARRAAFEGVNGTENIIFETNSANVGLYVSSADKDIIKNFNSITYNNGLSLWKQYSSNYGQFDAAIRTAPWAGDGTSSNPFKITNVADLKQIATEINNNSYTLDQHFELTSDIDCGNEGPMASIGIISNNAFQGTFDGDDGNGGNYKIINQTTPYGLFGFISEKCVIKNLTIDNCTVTGTNSGESVAGLVAEIRSSDAEINNCHVINSSISSGDNDNILNAGGIVGYQFSSTVTGCSVENTTITMTQQNRSSDQKVGGISGYFNGGTIQNCDVKSSTISSQTSGTNELYTGAIAGELGIPVTLTNNTYDASVQVKTKKGSASEVVRSGNDQRGTGQADANGDFDVFYDSNNNVVNGAVLTGLQTINVDVGSNGTVEYLEGYYRYDQQNKKVYALPYSISTQKTKIKATSNLGYDQPTISLTLNGGSYNLANTTAGTDNTGAANATWEFEMPEDDLTATIAFPLDFSNANRTFAISNPADAKKVYDGNQISITQIKTKPSSNSAANTEITLDYNNGDFTITEYKQQTTTELKSLGTTAPTNAGNYKVVIKGNGNFSGTATVDFKIEQADGKVSVTNLTQEVTYDGNSHALSGVSVTGGTAVVTYYEKEADRTAGTSGTTQAPTKANVYYVKVSQGNANYASQDVLVTFTINPADIKNAVITAIAEDAWTYDGTAKKPTPEVKFNNKKLTEGDDFTYSWSNNTNAAKSTDNNAPEVIITGKGNFTKTNSLKFTINKATMTGIQASGYTGAYDGAKHGITVTAPAGATVKYGTNVGSYTDTKSPEYKDYSANPYTVYYEVSQANYNTVTGSQDVVINKRSLSGATIGTIAKQTYNKAPHTPEPDVSLVLTAGGQPTKLEKGTDYKFSYENNTDAGRATIKATGQGNFMGDASWNFDIDKADATITFAPDIVYEATYLDQDFTKTVSNTGDGVVKYSSGDENVATVNQTTGQVSIVGSAPNGILMTATVQDGKNYQYATKTATYTLIVKEATLTGVQATGYTGDYDGAGHGITVTAPAGATVKYGTNANSCTDTRSPEYKDYSANPYKVYYEVSQANFATVKGSQTVTINKRSLSGASISQVANETYNGNPYTPEPDVTLVLVAGNQATKLEKGTDYTLAYENNTNAGTATVKVIGTKNFKDEESVNFTISKADISTAVIDAIAAQTYTGSAITPTPAVTWGGKTLKAGTDFTYSYANNTDAAQSTDTPAPTVTITGKGNFTSSASTKFTILDRVASIDLGGRTFRTYYNASETNRVPDDIQAYIVTGVNGNEVTVQPVSYIPKQTPVLLEAKAGAKSVKNKADDFTTNKLAYATNDVAANGNQYLLYNGEFVRASGTISGKVYLDLGSNSPARSYTINTDNTTAIEGVFDEETDGEEKWYDMQGRQINKPTKAGLYIRNGQKVVIKNK